MKDPGFSTDKVRPLTEGGLTKVSPVTEARKLMPPALSTTEPVASELSAS